MKCLITGHTSGIGKALKELMETEGYEVDGISLSKGFDVGKEKDWIDWMDGVEQKYDLVFLNAGMAKFGIETEFVFSKQMCETNFMGVYYGLHFLERYMKEGGTCVVTVSSIHNKTEVEMPLYAATKAAAHSLMRSFANRYKDKFRVFGVSPGYVATNLGGQGGKIPKELTDTIAIKRPISPIEMAGYMYGLVIDFPALVGEDVVISGGQFD